MVKKVIIIGGGVAGLTAGASLVARGIRVDLFESRPYLGGRVYSFTDPETKDSVDNGQHLLAGFYYDTFKLLSLIGSSDHIARQERLAINFIGKGGRVDSFTCPRVFSPLHLIWGLFRFQRFPGRDLLNLIINMWRIRRDLHAKSADEVLDILGQGREAKESFFRPLILATLNAEPKEVSGALFMSLLRRIVSVPAGHSVLAYSTVGLSDLIAEPVSRFISENGGDIYCSRPIEKIDMNGDRIDRVIDYFGEHHSADAYIAALPPDALAGLLPAGLVEGVERWSYSPIVSVNIWLDREVGGEMMAGLEGGKFHWYFDKSRIVADPESHRYITLLASAAADKINLSKDEIVAEALGDMRTYLPAARSAEVLHTQVIKERCATVLITPETEGLRPPVKTECANLFLAGDWIDTGLPATVESAARSGFMAAERSTA